MASLTLRKLADAPATDFFALLGRDAARAKREEASRSLDRLMIAVPLLPRDKLLSRACDHYNGLQAAWADQHGADGPHPATPDSDPAFLARIAAGYLRNAMSGYERELEARAGMVGAAMVYWELRRKLLEAIAAAYPWLAPECARQTGGPTAPTFVTMYRS